MKKNKILVMVLIMAMTLMVGGCGDKKDTSTVETSVDEVVETTNNEEETVEDKVIPDGDIVFYEETGMSEYTVIGDYEDIEKEIVTDKEIPVYSEDGIEVGHTKVGVTIKFESKNVRTTWYKFKNPVEGTDYEYLYMSKNHFYTESENTLTQDEILDAIKTRFSDANMGYTLLDAPTDDMESLEFSVSKEETIADLIVDTYLYEEKELYYYLTFYVEALDKEDELNYWFKIYYKDNLNSVTQESNNETSATNTATEVNTASVDNTPVSSEPVVETPVVDNSKYTPDEAIAMIRNHHESNGMIWDPSIKEFASWGTGWFSLDKNSLMNEIKNDFAGYQYGDGAGNSTTNYYMEVTSSDDDYVYVTVWGCD